MLTEELYIEYSKAKEKINEFNSLAITQVDIIINIIDELLDCKTEWVVILPHEYDDYDDNKFDYDEFVDDQDYICYDCCRDTGSKRTDIYWKGQSVKYKIPVELLFMPLEDVRAGLIFWTEKQEEYYLKLGNEKKAKKLQEKQQKEEKRKLKQELKEKVKSLLTEEESKLLGL